MIFIKNIHKIFMITMFAAVFHGTLVTGAGINSFAGDWEPVSRGLAAIVSPASGERVNLTKFRDSKLILDTAIAFIQSNISSDASLVSTMVRRRFNWDRSALQPLRDALARLQALRDATVVTGHSEDCHGAAVFSNPALQYMMPHMESMKRAKVKLKAVSKMLLMKKKSSGLANNCECTREILVEDHSKSLEEPEQHSFVSSGFLDEASLEGSFLTSSEDLPSQGDCSSSSSMSTVDIKAEFIVTNDALAKLEADILSQLSGGVRTVIVTQTKILGTVRKPIMNIEDALARLKELRPELDEIMAALSGAIVGMCAKFRKRMPELIMERAYLSGLLCLGDEVENARALLDITSGK
jgi:hypothetical protein